MIGSVVEIQVSLRPLAPEYHGSPSSKLSFVKIRPALRIEGKSSICLTRGDVVPVMVGVGQQWSSKIHELTKCDHSNVTVLQLG